ncbi:7433_t:CDS:2, partial [Racocetra fulgida]
MNDDNNDAMNDTVSDAVSDSMNDAVSDLMNNAVMNDAMNDAVDDAINDTVNNTMSDAMKDAMSSTDYINKIQTYGNIRINGNFKRAGFKISNKIEFIFVTYLGTSTFGITVLFLDFSSDYDTSIPTYEYKLNVEDVFDDWSSVDTFIHQYCFERGFGYQTFRNDKDPNDSSVTYCKSYRCSA